MQSYLPDLFLLTMVLIQVAWLCKKQPLRLSLSFIQRDVYTDTFAQTYACTHTQSHTQRLWETMEKKYDNILRKDMFLKWIKVLLLNNRKALAYSLAVGKCKWKTQCCKNWLVPDICVCVCFFFHGQLLSEHWVISQREAAIQVSTVRGPSCTGRFLRGHPQCIITGWRDLKLLFWYD